jgi:signal transduction histidine kinase
MGVRPKLVLLSLAILVVVSFGFTLLQLALWRAWIEDDLEERAVAFAREIAATIADRREFESGGLLEHQIAQIMAVRQNVLHLDILGFTPGGTAIIASSQPLTRLPFTRKDAEQVRSGRVASRLVAEASGRWWEVMAPISLEGTVVGAVAAKFSLTRADAFAQRTRTWAFALTAVSVLVMGLLMTAAVAFVVNRPVRRFMEAIQRVQQGASTATVDVPTADEFGVLARHFNDMMARIHDFSDELQTRIREATHELETRYREVERLRDALFAMQRELGHAERLALSGRIMAEVAHEVGTPLHSIAGHLELLRQDLPAALVAEPVRRRLGVIEDQLARVTEIIAQLLDLTRRSRGEPSPLDLGRLVRDTIEVVRPALAGAGLGLDVVNEPELPLVRGHGNQLQQVILNLLTNAMDATPAGGRIRVVTRARLATGQVELEVADTGRGIAPDEQRRLFEPFFSTKEPGHGTGLGLFISAQIVREHAGRIEVTSALECGSTFRVVLPAAASPA